MKWIAEETGELLREGTLRNKRKLSEKGVHRELSAQPDPAQLTGKTIENEPPRRRKGTR